ncbi:MAG TPA: PaaI family thioesterase [Rhizomicrobium sp.]|nr:PaaI family thioesterase [Rhizomicrobium sp.]
MTETVFDRFPRPPCAELLGAKLLAHDAKQGWARFSFEGRAEFLNPAGFVQGGLLAAMLDDTMGPTVLLASEGRLYTATIDMNVSFLAPARAGTLTSEGRVVQLGKTIAFMEAVISDAAGTKLARATGSARLVPVEKLPR